MKLNVLAASLLLLSAAPVMAGSTGSGNQTTQSSTVVLSGFNAVTTGYQVDISWKSVQEVGSSYFTIERSSDGVNFIEVTRVNAAGNSTSLLEYYEIDKDPLPGTSFYRLKQTLTSGEYIISDQITVKRPECGMDPTAVSGGSPVDAPVFLGASAFGNEETLVVVKDKAGNEYYAKVMLIYTKDKIIAYDPNGNIIEGTYTIIASSNDELQQRKVVVE